MTSSPPPLCVAVAYSGGRDSTALLHCTLRMARPLGVQVLALHVHHGLQSAADDFERHCASTCDALSVPLHIGRVDARHDSGDSPEDAARHQLQGWAEFERDGFLRHFMHQRRAVGQQQLGAFARRRQGDAAADALGGARHDHYLVLEPVRMDHAAPPLLAENFSK